MFVVVISSFLILLLRVLNLHQVYKITEITTVSGSMATSSVDHFPKEISKHPEFFIVWAQDFTMDEEPWESIPWDFDDYLDDAHETGRWLEIEYAIYV